MWQGEVVSIHITSERGGSIQTVDETRAIPGKGLDGDRFYALQPAEDEKGKSRQITLIELEAIEAIRREKGIELAPKDARRNIVTRGVPLNHLVGKIFQVGSVRLRGIRLCEPCFHLGDLTQPEVEAALVHRGGLRAEILNEGIVRSGDAITPLDS